MKVENFTFGLFLQPSIWQEAKKLLDFQIEQRKTNKHYNKIGFFHFEKAKPYFDHIGDESYFNEKIRSNFFYALQDEFYAITYPVPKKGFGIRNYYFFSYPMQVLYYAIGLYLLKLSQQFVSDSKSSKIHSFYGGNLHFQDNKLVINKETTYYRNNYLEFNKKINALTSDSKRGRFVIHLDIQNYYDSISIPILLNLLERVMNW